MQTLTLDQALTDFLTTLRARNASMLTAQAYATDIRQFISWLQETTVLDLKKSAKPKPICVRKNTPSSSQPLAPIPAILPSYSCFSKPGSG